MGKFFGCLGIAILGFVAGHIYGKPVFDKLNELTNSKEPNKQ